MKNIEVEIRGPLTKAQYDYLHEKFSKEGKFVMEKDRLAICFPDPKTGSYVEECNVDIRVRCTNGIPELIVKKGKWGTVDESRKEFSLVGEAGKFDEMIQMLAVMGFDRGMAISRKGSVYMYKAVEFSLVEVPGHSYYFEAEIMSEEKDKEKAIKKLSRVCKDLNLKLFDEQGFYNYINQLNEESNKDYCYKQYNKDFFQENF